MISEAIDTALLGARQSASIIQLIKSLNLPVSAEAIAQLDADNTKLVELLTQAAALNDSIAAQIEALMP